MRGESTAFIVLGLAVIFLIGAFVAFYFFTLQPHTPSTPEPRPIDRIVTVEPEQRVQVSIVASSQPVIQNNNDDLPPLPPN
jgi:hypothetical protein